MIVKRRALALVLILTALVFTGCTARGGVVNAGWTVAAEQDGSVYAALATGQVLALDLEQNGAKLWQYPEKEASAAVGCSIAKPAEGTTESPLDAVYGEPLVLDDVVVVGSFDGKLYAFDRESGRQVWDYAAAAAIIGGATEADGVLYFGSSDGSVYAIDAATQQSVWATPFATGNRVWGAPRVDQEHVYVASMDRSVYALDRSTGQQVWKHDLGASAPGAMTLADGRLYVGNVNRHLICLSATDGSELWRSPQYGGWVWGEALVADGGVYFGSLDGVMHALNAVDGSVRWADVPLSGAVRAGPALAGASLIVGTESGYVYTVDIASGEKSLVFGDRDGERLGPVLSTPVVAGDKLIVTTAQAKIVALDLTKRDPVVWVYPPAEVK